ncbi:hypothetical protein B0T26DRAFT_520163 [Lasiosphaeria miniovina]|uniref:Uncharacterized protein n=1 Tax=Lasiosphaeria miniovina TaxID=1954250 RepID=A0AA39ZUY1_9PEZI|nr:uncharacterized protein B0T26DRAFT_520163 [Lasiosphaeria miniovina]KAK0703995.1 hypothetical protein B0T26DRAFT_520163 [Lasiosphaeria miniovina]
MVNFFSCRGCLFCSSPRVRHGTCVWDWPCHVYLVLGFSSFVRTEWIVLDSAPRTAAPHLVAIAAAAAAAAAAYYIVNPIERAFVGSGARLCLPLESSLFVLVWLSGNIIGGMELNGGLGFLGRCFIVWMVWLACSNSTIRYKPTYLPRCS